MKSKVELGNQLRTVKVQITTPASRQASFQERIQPNNQNTGRRGIATGEALKSKRIHIKPSQRGT